MKNKKSSVLGVQEETEEKQVILDNPDYCNVPFDKLNEIVSALVEEYLKANKLIDIAHIISNIVLICSIGLIFCSTAFIVILSLCN